MPWHRASPTAKAYYYRSVRSGRVDGQPRRQYVGGGLVGEAAATADARRRVEREIQARAWRREQARRDAALAPLLELIRVTDLLAEAMAQAIDSLHEQLVIANRRAECADRRADQERSLLEEARARIADAVAAERIAAGEAAALRTELDRRRDWKLLRRLRWALRGDR